ncbi:MAG: transcriptional regulator with XRE-family HTH domain [Candidatus Marinamargulisbacteria bacterium]|jgi:transcriptional regulator with XRE-family HTH domain
MKRKRDVPDAIREKVTQIGQRIATLRKAKSLSRERLAYSIGISKSFLGYIELGQANPTVETLYLIADGLDCNVTQFFQ